MNNKILYILVSTFVLSTIVAVSNTSMASAFIGVFVEDDDVNTEYQYSGSTQSNSQTDRCYAPNGAVVNSCNSEESTDSTDTGYNILGQ